jgi:hypothetical protein
MLRASAYRRHTENHIRAGQHHAAMTGTMSQTASARVKPHRTLRPNAIGVVVVSVAIIGTVVHQSASSSAPSFSGVPRGDHGGATTEADGGVRAPSP